MHLRSLITFSVFVLELGASSGVYVCPRGVPKDGYSKVYGKTCYRFVLVNRRYFWAANDDCSRHSGGTLAMIRNNDTKTFLANQIKDNLEKVPYWVGMYRKIMPGFSELVHVDGSIVNGEPRTHAAHVPGEDCVTLSESGHMGISACVKIVTVSFDPKRPYICQYPAWDDPSITTSTAPTTTSTEPTSTSTEPTSTSTEPTTTSTEPTTTSTEPTTTTTEPTTTSTEPTTTSTEPATTSTEPATTSTEPATTSTEPATTSSEPATTQPSTPKPTCPPFVCTKDCGMDGYILDGQGCSLCECDI